MGQIHGESELYDLLSFVALDRGTGWPSCALSCSSVHVARPTRGEFPDGAHLYLRRARWTLRRGFEGRCLACTRAPALLGSLPGTRLYVLDAVALARRFALSPTDLAAVGHNASIRGDLWRLALIGFVASPPSSTRCHTQQSGRRHVFHRSGPPHGRHVAMKVAARSFQLRRVRVDPCLVAAGRASPDTRTAFRADSEPRIVAR